MLIPYNFKPRSYQQAVYDAFLMGKRRFCCVWHRRSGKDKTFLNLSLMATHLQKGNYIYVFPELTHARKVIWNGIDSEGHRFLDHFPQSIIKRKNDTEMFIEFTNGSTFQLMGSDNYDKLRGINPMGIVFSEYQEHHPVAWDTLRPIIAENGGWVVFQGTPKGHNHFYDVYMYSQENPDWHSSKLTVNQTKRENGEPIIGLDVIEEERRSGMEEYLIQQEYYCDFSTPVAGAYYADLLKNAEDEGRIKELTIEPNLPVYTFWDLGVDDSTAIWFFQYVNSELRFIDFYENRGIGMPKYIEYLNGWAKQNNVGYDRHFAPHDIKVTEFGTGKTRWEIAQSFGLRFDLAPNLGLMDGINMVRVLFPRMWFNKHRCAVGINCLRKYHKEYDELRKCFSLRPAHDWASHGADAMRYFAVSWQDYFGNQRPFGQIVKEKARL
jgi:hypothetical protein